MILSSLCRVDICQRIAKCSKSPQLNILMNFSKRMVSSQLFKSHTIRISPLRRFYHIQPVNSNHGQKAKKSMVKSEFFARSHPRQHRAHEKEKFQDNVPKDWDVIFSSGIFGWKITALHCLAAFAFLAIPLVSISLWDEYEVAENVILGSFVVPKRTEVVLFFFVNMLIFQAAIKVANRLPLRIYHVENEQKFVAVLRTYLPFRSTQMEFKSTDVFDLPSKQLPLKLKPWRDHEYKIKNRILLLPPSCFRSGSDSDWMMRDMRMLYGRQR